jgi:hypothetical protein
MLNVVRAWILLSTLLAGAGWILSAFHELNRPGYAVVFALAAAALVFWKKSGWPPRGDFARAFHKFRKRFRRPAPLLFLALALMSLAAGALYCHSNGDTNSYRIPRVWHWLASEHWHWIRTADLRMNVVASGFEWLSAPLMLFTGTDQFLFLLNWISYLMLPGLIFSVFTRLQIRPRAAWWWTWFLAAGWCFAVQASSDANDSFAAVYILAAVDLALRARKNKAAADLWLSMLAAALATGVKQSDIPLALLWLVAAWPGLRLALARPLATLFVAATSLLVSALPATILNLEHAGNWQGLAMGTAKSAWSAGSPFWKFAGNVFCIPVQNLLPPFFPWSGAWDGMISRFLQTPLGAHFRPFERFGHLYAGISEASAGIGLGICCLTLISILAARAGKTASPTAGATSSDVYFRWLRVTPWFVLLVFMVEICSFSDARLLSPYYLFLFPLVLFGSRQENLARRLWWQRLGLSSMLLTAALLVVSRDRPLFPAVTITGRLQAAHPQSKLLSRLWLSYAWPRSVEQQRNFLRKDLPPDGGVVGYATTSGCAEPGLWLPFGSRRVERVLADDTPEQLRSQGICYVLVEDYALVAAQMTLEQWMQHYDASLVDQLEFHEDPYRPPGHYYLVRLNQPPGKTR